MICQTKTCRCYPATSVYDRVLSGRIIFGPDNAYLRDQSPQRFQSQWWTRRSLDVQGSRAGTYTKLLDDGRYGRVGHMPGLFSPTTIA